MASTKPWRTERLGDPAVAQIVMGQSPPSSTYNTERVGLPFYQGKADFGYINPTPRVWCSAPSRVGEAGDILMSVRAPVGDVNLTNSACALGRGIAAIRARSESNSIFLYYALQYAKPQLIAASSGAIFESINKVALHDLEIPLPPPPEQQKIAAVLWKLQRAIATQDRLLAATADLKQSGMQRLFTHGLKGEPLRDTEIGPMPQSWDSSTLGALCKTKDGAIQTGPFGSQLHAQEYQADGVPVVNPTHLLGNQINHESVPKISRERAQELSRHKLEKGDILFARRGQIGRHGLIGEEEIGWICGTGCFLVRVRHPDIANEYLPCFFSLPGVVSWLEANAAGVIMPNLNNTVLARLPIYFPSKDEQRAIASALATLDHKLAHHRAKRAALHDLFKTLLHKLMTAEIRVADLDIDTSEVADHFVDADKMVGHAAKGAGR